MRNFITGILFFILCTPGVSGQDRLLDLLKREMSHQMQELQQQELPPYYMNYRMVDEYATRITTAFGVLMDDTYKHERTLDYIAAVFNCFLTWCNAAYTYSLNGVFY